MSRERRRPLAGARRRRGRRRAQSKYILCMLFYVTSRRGELCSLTPTTDPPRTVTQSPLLVSLPVGWLHVESPLRPPAPCDRVLARRHGQRPPVLCKALVAPHALHASGPASRAPAPPLSPLLPPPPLPPPPLPPPPVPPPVRCPALPLLLVPQALQKAVARSSALPPVPLAFPSPPPPPSPLQAQWAAAASIAPIRF